MGKPKHLAPGRNVLAWIGMGSAAAALVGSLWTGWMTLDARWAKAAELKQLAGQTDQRIQGIDRTLKTGQQQQLRREEIELQREQERRRLSEFERRRLEEVRDQLQQLKHELGGK